MIKVRPTAEDGKSANGATAANGEGTSSLVRTLSSVLNQASQSTAEDQADSASLEGNLKNGKHSKYLVKSSDDEQQKHGRRN